jgi:hypothetical protein
MLASQIPGCQLNLAELSELTVQSIFSVISAYSKSGICSEWVVNTIIVIGCK